MRAIPSQSSPPDIVDGSGTATDRHHLAGHRPPPNLKNPTFVENNHIPKRRRLSSCSSCCRFHAHSLPSFLSTKFWIVCLNSSDIAVKGRILVRTTTCNWRLVTAGSDRVSGNSFGIVLLKGQRHLGLCWDSSLPFFEPNVLARSGRHLPFYLSCKLSGQ